jgi:Ca2+-binding EF-hand superfamily protein
MRRLTLLCAAALLAGPAAAQDADRTEAIRTSFESADRNGDGMLDIDEYVAHYVSAFDDFDKTQEGFLLPSDLPDVDEARFAAADRNGDGRISLGEAVAERIIVFFEIDTMRNGMISLDEILAYEAKASN